MNGYRHAVLVCAALIGSVPASFAAAAQVEENYPAGTFTVGEQVTSDPMAMNRWRTCTVTGVRPRLGDDEVLDSVQVKCSGLDLSVPARADAIRKGGGAAKANSSGGPQGQLPQPVAAPTPAPAGTPVPVPASQGPQ